MTLTPEARADIRRYHQRAETPDDGCGELYSCIASDCDYSYWPCIPIRLCDALDALDAAEAERDAAQAQAARLAGLLGQRGHVTCNDCGQVAAHYRPCNHVACPACAAWECGQCESKEAVPQGDA